MDYLNEKEKIYHDCNDIYDSVIYLTFCFIILPFMIILAYFFLFYYKLKNKYKTIFIIIEICSLIIKSITILLTYIINKKYANKQNLKTEFKEIQYR